MEVELLYYDYDKIKLIKCLQYWEHYIKKDWDKLKIITEYKPINEDPKKEYSTYCYYSNDELWKKMLRKNIKNKLTSYSEEIMKYQSLLESIK